MEEYSLFDKRIDLNFYDEDFKFLYAIKTPAIGRKPEITVDGTFLSNNGTVQTTITITNFDYSFDLGSIVYVGMKLYYGNTFNSSSIQQNKVYLLKILWHSVIKTAPDRQVAFYCVYASEDIKLANYNVNLTISSKNNTIEAVLNSLVYQIRTNLSKVKSAFSSIDIQPSYLNGINKTDVLLAPVYGDNGKEVPQVFEGSLTRVLSDICRASVIEIDGEMVIKYNIFIASDGKLCIQINPSKGKQILNNSTILVANQSNKKVLNYLMSVSRGSANNKAMGPVFTIKTLFDPSITLSDTLLIPKLTLTDKKLGDLVVSKNDVTFFETTSLISIAYEFSTTTKNTMEILAVVGEYYG